MRVSTSSQWWTVFGSFFAASVVIVVALFIAVLDEGAGIVTSHDHTSALNDGGILTDDEHDGFSQYSEILTPSTAPTDTARLYATDDGGVTRLALRTASPGESFLLTQAYVTVQDEASSLTQRSLLNFIGPGVDCVDSAPTTECTILGGVVNGAVFAWATLTSDSGTAVPNTATDVLDFTVVDSAFGQFSLTDAFGSAILSLDVFAQTCLAGDFVTGIAGDGAIQCATPIGGVGLSWASLTADVGTIFPDTTADIARFVSADSFLTITAVDGVGSGTLTFDIETSVDWPNAVTATALAADPSDCSPLQFATGIAANGNLTCSDPGSWFSDFVIGSSGTLTANSHNSTQTVLAGLGLGLTATPATDTWAPSILASFRLPQSCANGQIAEYATSTTSWLCGDDDGATQNVWSSIVGNSGSDTPNTATDILNLKSLTPTFASITVSPGVGVATAGLDILDQLCIAGSFVTGWVDGALVCGVPIAAASIAVDEESLPKVAALSRLDFGPFFDVVDAGAGRASVTWDYTEGFVGADAFKLDPADCSFGLLAAAITATGTLLCTDTWTFDHDHTSATLDGGVLTNDEHDGYSSYVNVALAPTPATTTLTFQAFQFGGRVRFVQKGGTGETLTIARDNAILVRASENLDPGDVVYVDSAAGLIANVTKYIADGSITVAPLGIMMETTTSGSVGLVMVAGVTGISAGHLTTGLEMWASATSAGDTTTTEPPHPNLRARLGTVLSGLAAPFGLVEIEPLIVRGDHEGTRLNTWKIGDTLAGAKSLTFYNGSVGTLQASPTADRTWILPDAGGTLRIAAYDTIQDEGTPLTQRDVLNFIGTAVTCADATTSTDCTVTGGAGLSAHLLLSTAHSDTVPGAAVLGALIFANASPNWDRLPGNVTATKQFLTQTGTGAASAAPLWATIVDGDVPATIVRTSRNINTSFPLTGGASLSADVTLACASCVVDTRQVNTSAPLGGGGSLVSNLTLTCASCVIDTRQVNTSAPLGGGGALTGNLTLTCASCVIDTRAVNTTGPLTGGGTLVGNLTLACGSCVVDTRTVGTSGPLGGGGALVSNLTLTCTTCEVTTNKDAANGYAGLNASALVPINRGGTNASTTQDAINNIGQLTTEGDLLYRNGSSNNVRLARGSDGNCLTSNATTIVWGSCAAGGGYATIQEEGAPLTQRTTVNFIGTPITCVDNATSTRTDCTVTGGGGAPGGADTYVQFNNAGAFGGDADFTWASTTDELTLGDDPSIIFDTFGNGTEVSTPASDKLAYYAKIISGRAMPKWRGPSGLDTPFQPCLCQNKVIYLSPNTTTTVSTMGAGAGSVGTVSHPQAVERTGYLTNYITSATINSAAGGSTVATMFWRGTIATGSNGFFFTARLFWPDTQASYTTDGTRNLVGFTSSTISNSVTGGDNPTGDHAAFMFSTTRPDTTWQFMTKDNTTQNLQNTGLAFIASNFYDFYIFTPPYPNNNTIYWRIDNLTAGLSYASQTSTNLPRANIALRSGYALANVTATQKNIRMKHMYVETDL